MWYDGQTKLSEKQVINIINDNVTPDNILAKKYNTTRANISKIRRGETWKRIHKRLGTTPRPPKSTKRLTDDVVRAIKNFEVDNFDELAKEYGVHARYLKSLQNPNMLTSWKHIPVKGYEDASSIPPVKRRKMTPKSVRDIFLNREHSAKVMACKYDVSVDVIYSIRACKRYTKITSRLTPPVSL